MPIVFFLKKLNASTETNPSVSTNEIKTPMYPNNPLKMNSDGMIKTKPLIIEIMKAFFDCPITLNERPTTTLTDANKRPEK